MKWKNNRKECSGSAFDLRL